MSIKTWKERMEECQFVESTAHIAEAAELRDEGTTMTVKPPLPGNFWPVPELSAVSVLESNHAE